MDSQETQKTAGTSINQATGITKGVGFVIRVGRQAKAYRVSHAVYSRYRLYKFLLFLLAIVVGVAVSYAGSYVFFGFVSPLAGKVTSILKNHPQVFQLLIYLSALFFSGLVYWNLRAKLGEKLAKDAVALDEGSDLIEQRRRSAMVRKRERLLLLLLLGAILFVPQDLSLSLQAFLALIPLYFLAEGVYFQFVSFD